ncbi:MAG TPA: hypothetical protein VGB14_19730 [Acidimicrobiales bacterium]|jgi:hypothetical protein
MLLPDFTYTASVALNGDHERVIRAVIGAFDPSEQAGAWLTVDGHPDRLDLYRVGARPRGD